MQLPRFPISRTASVRLAIAASVLTLSARWAAATVQFADPLPLGPLEAQLLADAEHGQFRHFALIDAALIASGAADAEHLRAYHDRYVAWLARAREACNPADSPLVRTQTLFEFMHREILHGGYDGRATELTRALDEGRFNCASATVLFDALANDCGLDARAVELPRHARSVVHAGQTQLDIETTCATWFQLDAEARQRAEAALTGLDGRALPAGERREISAAQLVAVIYYNRGVERLAEKQFAAAVSLNLRALRLDPDSSFARANLLAAVNNWALDRLAAGDFHTAAELLAAGLRVDPHHEPFHNNQRHVYRLWVESLAAAGRPKDAATVLAAARQIEPAAPLWDQCARQLGL